MVKYWHDESRGPRIKVRRDRKKAICEPWNSIVIMWKNDWKTHQDGGRNSQILWMGHCQADSDSGLSVDGSGAMATGRSRSSPLGNNALARTTRSGRD